MNCNKDTLILLSTYADGETNKEETKKVLSHLETCDECRKLLEEWQGQSQVMKWAFTEAMPVDKVQSSNFMPIKESIKMENAKTKTKKSIFKPIQLRWKYAFAAILLFVLIGAVNFIFNSQKINIGDTITGSTAKRNIIMKLGVVLKIGPNSKIVRLTDKSIRLDKGWVSASVSGNNSITIITKRFEVTDQGTKFTVGTTSKFDYVVVGEGSVFARSKKGNNSISKGNILIADDKNIPYIAKLPIVKDTKSADLPSTGPQGWSKTNLDRRQRVKEDFLPDTFYSLNFSEGINRLEGLFPNIRTSYTTYGYSSSKEGLYFRVSLGVVEDFNKGINEHLSEIMQATAGDIMDNGDWEFPAAIISLSENATNPRMLKDTYLVNLASINGKLIWRFVGSLGSNIDLPVEFKYFDELINSDEDIWSVENISYSKSGFIAEIMPYVWPGKKKAIIRIVANVTEVSPDYIENSIMLSALIKEFPIIGTFGVDRRNFEPRYLDPAKKNKFSILWNENSKDKLLALFESSKRGKGGELIMGLIVSDTPLVEPALAKGKYILKLVVPSTYEKPYFELLSANNNSSVSLRLREKELFKGGATSLTSSSNLKLKIYSLNKDEYQFRFGIRYPSDKDIRIDNWAEGYIRVKKP